MGEHFCCSLDPMQAEEAIQKLLNELAREDCWSSAERESVRGVEEEVMLSDFMSSNLAPHAADCGVLISPQHSGAMVSSTRTKGW